MRSFIVHRLDEHGTIFVSDLFQAEDIEEARRYASVRLAGYAEVQVWESGKCLLRINRAGESAEGNGIPDGKGAAIVGRQCK